MDPYLKTALTALAMLVVGWLLKTGTDAYLKRSDKKERDDGEILKRLGEIESRLKVLDIQVSPFWGAVQTEMLKTLHHDPKHGSEFAESDALIDKFAETAPGDIEPADRTRMKELMLIRSTDQNPAVSDIERATAKIIALVIDKASAEAAAPPEESTPQLVSVPDAKPGEAPAPEPPAGDG